MNPPVADPPPNTDQATCSDAEVESRALAQGCTCPALSPPGVNPAYHQEAVTKWFTALERDCDALSDRGLILDCDEFPCLLFIERQGQEIHQPDLDKLLCADQIAGPPELVYNGLVGGQDDLFLHNLSVRPPDLNGTAMREMSRSMTVQSRQP